MVARHVAVGVPGDGEVAVHIVDAVLLHGRLDADDRRGDLADGRLRGRFGGGLGGGLGRRFRRRFGRRGRRGGRGLRRLEGKAHVRGLAVRRSAVDRHGGDAQGVDLALAHVARAQRGGGGGELLRVERLPHAVEDLYQIVVHVAAGSPADGQRAFRHVLDAIDADALHRIDGHRGDADLAGCGRGRGGGHRRGRGRGSGRRRRRALEGELQMRPTRVVHGAVLGNGAHGDGIDHAFVHGGKREVAAGVGHLLGNEGVAGAVGHAHVVGGHVAIGAPGEVHAARGGIQIVDAAGHGVDRRNAQHGRADLAGRGRGRGGGHGRGRGLDVGGRAVGEEQLLRLHRSHAADLQPRRALEQLHGRLGDGAEVAGDVGVVVVQFAQAALQGGHAVVGIAALQRDVAAVFRRAGGEESILQRGCGRAGLPQAQLGLQALDGGDGGVVVGAAGRALIVVEGLEALVQFTHAVAGVALFHVDVAGAVARGGGVEPLQRLAGGGAAAGKAVLLLEEGHGLLGARAVDAVRAVGQITQFTQAVLQNGHAQAGVAAIERLVGVVGGRVIAEEQVLQFRRGHAVDAEAPVHQIGLEQTHGVLRVGAEDAVGIVVEIAKVDEALLQGAHILAAAAARERAVFLLRLKHVGAGLLARDLPGGGKAGDGARLLRRLRRGLVAKVEGGHFAARPAVGFKVFGVKVGVEGHEAAHGLQAQAGERVALLGKFRKVKAVEGGQFARIDIYAVDLARAAVEQEQALGADGKLRHARAQGGEHAPGHLRRVEDLEAVLPDRLGDVIELALQHGEVRDAEIDELHFARVQRLHAQQALAAEAHEGVVCVKRGGGNFAGVFGKGPGAVVVEQRALIRLQRGDHALRQQAQVHDVAAGRGHLRGRGLYHRAACVDLQTHQRRGRERGDVVDRVARHRAGMQGVVRQRRLAQVGKVEAHQRAAEVAQLLAGQIQHFLLVHMDDLRGVLLGHRTFIAGQIQAALTVHIGADAARGAGQDGRVARVQRRRAHLGSRLPHRAPRSGRGRDGQQQAQRQRQSQEARECFAFHTVPLHFGIGLPLRRSPPGGGSVFCRFSPCQILPKSFHLAFACILARMCYNEGNRTYVR